MPSPKRRRTLRPKKRRPNRGKQLLWLLLIANLASGVLFSPTTAVRKVRIVGAGPEHTAMFREVTERWHGVPWARLDLTGARSQILETSEFRSVSIEANPFGRALITVEPRIAVARVEGASSLFLDRDGVLFTVVDHERESGEEGIELVLDFDRGYPTGTVIQHWEGGTIAYLCEKLNSAFPKVAFVVIVDQLGDIIIRHADGRDTLLGSSDRLDEKLDRFVDLAGPNGELRSDISLLNLVEPDRPAARMKQ